MQLLISSIDGRLLSFSFPTTHVSLASIKQAFEDREGVPVDELRVSCNGRCLPEDCSFTEEQAFGLPPLRVGLRVVGGKGGFGSLLRGGNTKVGQKKTTNFDACRDLNGRRLRHVNNEKRLAEWYAQEKDREMARIGERHARVAEKQSGTVSQFDEEAYNQSLETIEEEVASSLQVGLAEARAARQHRQANPPPPPSAPSWDFAYSDSEDEEDDDDEEEEGDNGEEEAQEKKGKEKEETASKANGKRDRGEDKEDSDEDEDEEKENNEARHTPKKAKKEESTTSVETTTACGAASALPPPPAWILG